MSCPSDAGEEPVLLSARQVAKLLQISQRTLWRLLSAGAIISPVKLGRSVRWRKDELIQWVADGCPIRHKLDKET
jgi:excisionase family DNA binding protein